MNIVKKNKINNVKTEKESIHFNCMNTQKDNRHAVTATFTAIAVAWIRTRVVAATTRSTNHYTITALLAAYGINKYFSIYNSFKSEYI